MVVIFNRVPYIFYPSYIYLFVGCVLYFLVHRPCKAFKIDVGRVRVTDSKMHGRGVRVLAREAQRAVRVQLDRAVRLADELGLWCFERRHVVTINVWMLPVYVNATHWPAFPTW